MFTVSLPVSITLKSSTVLFSNSMITSRTIETWYHSSISIHSYITFMMLGYDHKNQRSGIYFKMISNRMKYLKNEKKKLETARTKWQDRIIYSLFSMCWDATELDSMLSWECFTLFSPSMDYMHRSIYRIKSS